MQKTRLITKRVFLCPIYSEIYILNQLIQTVASLAFTMS